MLQTLVSYFTSLKEKFLEKNPSFYVQLMFGWLLLKILGLFHLPFSIKLCSVIALVFFLMTFWGVLSPLLFNNMAFQYFLFSFLKIANYCGVNLYRAFLLGFLLSFCSSFFVSFYKVLSIQLFSYTVFCPSLDFFLFFLLCFKFFEKFNSSVVSPAIEKLMFETLDVEKLLPKELTSFFWEDVIFLINVFFKYDPNTKGKVVIVNKIPFKKISLEHFPVPKPYVFSLYKTTRGYHDIVGKIAEMVEIDYDRRPAEIIEKMEIDLAKKIGERLDIVGEMVDQAKSTNQKFCSWVFRGLIVGLLTVIFVLNI